MRYVHKREYQEIFIRMQFTPSMTQPVSLLSTDDKMLRAVARAFRETGVPVATWARAKGFNPSLVYRILGGQQKCLRGQSHQIAVSLGLKPGVIGSLEQLEQQLKLARATEPSKSSTPVNVAASSGGAAQN